jgi:hypothetical protein
MRPPDTSIIDRQCSQVIMCIFGVDTRRNAERGERRRRANREGGEDRSKLDLEDPVTLAKLYFKFMSQRTGFSTSACFTIVSHYHDAHGIKETLERRFA